MRLIIMKSLRILMFLSFSKIICIKYCICWNARIGSNHYFYRIKIPIHIADEPLTAVARGTGLILEDLDSFREVLVSTEDDLPLQ